MNKAFTKTELTRAYDGKFQEDSFRQFRKHMLFVPYRWWQRVRLLVVDKQSTEVNVFRWDEEGERFNWLESFYPYDRIGEEGFQLDSE